MAHNIAENKRMFYTGEAPWHGLGKKLENPATSREAIVAAGLDFEVEKQPLTFMTGDALKTVPQFRATVRKDTGDFLGMVSERYTIVQNAEAFDFFDNIVGEKAAMYHTAGALGKGERIWILAKLPKNIIVFRDDVVEKYLLLTTSHDGRSPLMAYFTPVRVVCQNTLNASMTDASNGIAIRHVGDITAKVQEAREVLGLSMKYFGEFEETAKVFCAKQMNSQRLSAYMNRVLDVEEADLKDNKRLADTKATLMTLAETGKGNDRPGVRGTLWAAYNGVTEYADHYKKINTEKDATNRLKSVWFGSSAKIKDRAFGLALSMVK